MLDPDAERLVATLGLRPHPEGGFFCETWRSPVEVVHASGRPRAASTAIYFLLPAGSFSAVHRVASEEVWHHYDGDPVELHVFDGERHERVVLGRAWERGERPQYVVPAGLWQAARPLGDRYALCGCTVSPGFDFSDFEMPSRDVITRLLPTHGDVLAKLTRA